MTIIGEKNIKELVGEVVSDKMDQTCVVLVKSVKMHPIYKKRFVVRKKYYAHNADNKADLLSLFLDLRDGILLKSFSFN